MQGQPGLDVRQIRWTVHSMRNSVAVVVVDYRIRRPKVVQARPAIASAALDSARAAYKLLLHTVLHAAATLCTLGYLSPAS